MSPWFATNVTVTDNQHGLKYFRSESDRNQQKPTTVCCLDGSVCTIICLSVCDECIVDKQHSLQCLNKLIRSASERTQFHNFQPPMPTQFLQTPYFLNHRLRCHVANKLNHTVNIQTTLYDRQYLIFLLTFAKILQVSFNVLRHHPIGKELSTTTHPSVNPSSTDL